MKLSYRMPLSLTAILLPIIILWATLFYCKMIDEINDETDDALEDYAERIIVRVLAGKELPRPDSGSNNNYWITPLEGEKPIAALDFHYYDSTVFIPEKEETEPVRVLTTVFENNENNFYRLTVAMPTFEKEDLAHAILHWMVILYFLLTVSIITVAIWVFNYNIRPLYVLLRWLDNYTPGSKNNSVPNTTTVLEFKKLNEATQQAVDRSEILFEQQKQFIGNISHELQTPLAILGNRVEWLIGNGNPDNIEIEELVKMSRTVNRMIRLNKTLLLLAKIENGQFPADTPLDLVCIVRENIEIYNEIYTQGPICSWVETPPFYVKMNESLASTLVSNLLKNAYVHTPSGGKIGVCLQNRTLTVFNDGAKPLHAEHIFDRFYLDEKKEGSTGLGLALVNAICQRYGLEKSYCFEKQQHRFTIKWH